MSAYGMLDYVIRSYEKNASADDTHAEEAQNELDALRALNAAYEKALNVALKYLSGGNGMASEDVAAVVNAALLQRTTSTPAKQDSEAAVELPKAKMPKHGWDSNRFEETIHE